MGKYSIKDVETLTGIQAHTLRIWEQRYNFIQPERTNTNIRYYSDQQLKYILNVAFLNHAGIKISKLAQMSKEEVNAEIENRLISQTDTNINIHALHSAMIDFDEIKFNQVVNSNIQKFGFDYTLSNIILPFLEKVGILWRISSINPAQEHFISNLIRQKIIVGIDQIPTEDMRKKKRFILFLPEGEFHELTLLMSYYLLKREQHEVIYMGASLPLLDLKKAVEFTNPDFLMTIVTISMQDQTIDEYINMISSSFKNCELIIGGAQLKSSILKHKGVSKLHAYSELQNLISHI